jgi:hypothetical protein
VSKHYYRPAARVDMLWPLHWGDVGMANWWIRGKQVLEDIRDWHTRLVTPGLGPAVGLDCLVKQE